MSKIILRDIQTKLPSDNISTDLEHILTDIRTNFKLLVSKLPDWDDTIDNWDIAYEHSLITGNPHNTTHALLGGLATGDDHTQYLLADGTRALNGDLIIEDDVKLYFGTDSAAELYYNSSTETIIIRTLKNLTDFKINMKIGGNDTTVVFVDSSDGDVYIYNNLSVSGWTFFYDAPVKIGDNIRLYAGNSADFEIYHDNTNTIFRNNLSNSDTIFYVNDGGTDTEVMRLVGADSNLRFPDNRKIRLGTGDDFELYHNGTNTIFRNKLSNSNTIFYVNDGGVDTEVMRLFGATGNVGIGVTPITKLHVVENNENAVISYFVNSHATNPYGLIIDFVTASPNNTTRYFLRCDDGDGAECYIWSDGSFGQVSDERVKENIINTGDHLEKIKNINIIEYNRKNDINKKLHIGISAQQLKNIYPHLITAVPKEIRNGKIKEERLMIYKIGLIPMIIKSIQESQIQIKELTIRIQELEK